MKDAWSSNWLTVENLIRFARSMMAYKILNKLSPKANSITFRGSILWNALNHGIKACTNMAAFNKKVIGWKGESCNCKLCR